MVVPRSADAAVLEPSCAAVFRSDAAELLGSDDTRLLGERTRTLAELLTESGWTPRPLLDELGEQPPPAGVPRRAVAQVLCEVASGNGPQ